MIELVDVYRRNTIKDQPLYKGIKLPKQYGSNPNSHSVLTEWGWIEECVICGKESGDCDHTICE